MNAPIKVSDIKSIENAILKTGYDLFDNILGGGIKAGASILIAGTPGAGKSTLVSSIASKASNNGLVLYVSGEESLSQVKDRLTRLGAINPNFYVYDRCYLDEIKQFVISSKPILLVIDSLQTLKKSEKEKLTNAKLEDNLMNMINFIQAHNVPTIFIGHTTKEGKVAGTLSLQHFVDVVFMLQRDKRMEKDKRIFTAIKNRFGEAGDPYVFTMTAQGLIQEGVKHTKIDWNFWNLTDMAFDWGINTLGKLDKR